MAVKGLMGTFLSEPTIDVVNPFTARASLLTSKSFGDRQSKIYVSMKGLKGT